MQLTQGTLLHGGAYRIEQVLGQGSFGITYLATHTMLCKKVAIKEFFMKELNGRGEDGSITGMSDGSLSMNYARKFQKEALNLSRLEHPNIVRVTDSFEDNGTFYYVMDFIEGENLNDYIKHNHVSQQEAVSIIRDIATALMYMHEEKHMLHLDLKPGNVMRRASDGHIFLIDFGLSKHYSNNGEPETSTTIGLGTAGYAPIEQANQAKNGEFRPTIDIYALGATFYKLLTGETPPAASELVSDEDILKEKLQEHNIEEALSYIVIKAMQPSEKLRLQSVRNILDIISPIISDQDTANSSNEETITNKNYNSKENKKKKRILIFTCLFILALAIILSCFLAKSEDEETLAVKLGSAPQNTEENIETQESTENNDYTKRLKNKSLSSQTKGTEENTNSATENTKNNDSASLLQKAISSNDYQTIQKLATQGYAAAYGPLAKYYLDNHEYTKAEAYAKKAKAAGFSEGGHILNTLENLGYYD